MKQQDDKQVQWVLRPASDGGQRLWQVREHRVAAGQLCWLQLQPGQWLEVVCGALDVAPALGEGAWLDARWGGTLVMDGKTQLQLQAGHVQALAADAQWCLRAGSEDARLRVWQAATWWQRLSHGRRAVRQPLAMPAAVLVPQHLGAQG